MGALLGKCGIAFTVVLDCAAPAEVLWKTLTDIRAGDQIFASVQSVEVLLNTETKKRKEKGKNECDNDDNDDDDDDDERSDYGVGTRWIEKRLYGDTLYEVHQTITALDEAAFTTSVGIDFAPHTRNTRNASSTFSISVIPVMAITDTIATCQLVASWAFVANHGVCANLMSCLCRPLQVRHSKMYFQLEMGELVTEAEKRYQKGIHERVVGN